MPLHFLHFYATFPILFQKFGYLEKSRFVRKSIFSKFSGNLKTHQSSASIKFSIFDNVYLSLQHTLNNVFCWFSHRLSTKPCRPNSFDVVPFFASFNPAGVAIVRVEWQQATNRQPGSRSENSSSRAAFTSPAQEPTPRVIAYTPEATWRG